MRGSRIVLVYALALAVGVFLQFDRIGPWLSAKFPDGMPAALAALVDRGEALHASAGLTGAALALDCATAPMFDGSYKNTYRCRDDSLASAAPQALQDRAGQDQNPDDAGSHQAEPKLVPPMNVLVVGDSLAVTLAVSLEKAFKDFDGVTMIPKGKIASGLQNPQYYNWEEALAQYLKEYDPKLVIVMMGANDAKYLSLDPESPEPAALADRHRAVYEARLKKFLGIMDENGVTSYWVGLPVMGDPDLSGKSRALNAIIREACQRSSHGRFLDTWPLLADQQGNYAQHLIDGAGRRVRVREGDKIHFSTAGGDIIAKAFMKDAVEFIALRPKGSKEMAEANAVPEEKKR